MRKSRFSEAQTVAILREAEKGSVAEVAKKHGISEICFPRNFVCQG
jgi:putative transposase